MGTLINIRRVGLNQFNSAELLDILRRVRRYIPEEMEDGTSDVPGSLRMAAQSLGAPGIGVSNWMIAQLDLYIKQLTDLNAQSRALAETDPRKEVEKHRSSVASYILSRVVNMRRVVEEEEVKAANTLYLVTRAYTGLTSLPANQRTIKIKGLIFDLRKPEYSEAVGLLGLEPYINRLEGFNKEYEDMTDQRSISRRANKERLNSKEIRLKVNDLMDDLMDYAFATNTLQPTEVSTEFIHQINNVFDEALLALKQRRANRKEEKPGDQGGGEDVPGSLGNV